MEVPKHRKLLSLLALSCLILLLYGPVIGYDFIAVDDGGQVLENEKIHRFTLENLMKIFSSATVSMYQPLTSLLFAFIIAIFGFKTAAGFHIASILLHILNSCLVYTVGQRLFKNKVNPLLFASLFAFHPLAVEAVSWVSATSSLVFTTFFLAGIIQYDRYLEFGHKKHYRASILVFFLGCLCKIQMIPFVFVLFLLDFLRGNQLIQKDKLYLKIPFVLIALVFTWVTLQFRGEQSGFTGNYNPILLVPIQITWYALKAFFPANLGIVYDWPQTLNVVWIVASSAVLSALIYLAYKKIKNKLFVFGLLFYLSNIILHTSLFSSFLGPYADRYGYLSVFGIWISVFSLFGQKQMKAVSIVGYVVMAIFFITAKQQTTSWEDTIALWSQNLKHQTASFSNGMRGQLYYEKGMYAAAQQDFEIVARSPDPRFEPEKYAYLYGALGIMTTDSDGIKSAQYFNQACQYDPSAGNLHNAGIAYEKINAFEKAERFYLKCTEISSTPKCFNSLSSLYFQLERFEDGAAITAQAIESGFEELIFYEMSCFFLIQTDQIEAARDHYEKAQKLYLEADNKTPDPILLNLGRMLKAFP